jgi:hypothetical protein
MRGARAGGEFESGKRTTGEEGGRTKSHCHDAPECPGAAPRTGSVRAAPGCLAGDARPGRAATRTAARRTRITLRREADPKFRVTARARVGGALAARGATTAGMVQMAQDTRSEGEYSRETDVGSMDGGREGESSVCNGPPSFFECCAPCAVGGRAAPASARRQRAWDCVPDQWRACVRYGRAARGGGQCFGGGQTFAFRAPPPPFPRRPSLALPSPRARRTRPRRRPPGERSLSRPRPAAVACSLPLLPIPLPLLPLYCLAASTAAASSRHSAGMASQRMQAWRR